MLERRMTHCLAIATALLLVSSGAASAVSYDLVAETITVAFPDGASAEMWGYRLASDATATVPGPLLEVPDGEDLTINLTNTLGVPTSIVIPGLGLGAAANPVKAGGRVQTFSANEAALLGGSASYTFPASGKPGTYLYESGSDPALQRPMGLYGAVIVRSSDSGRAYDDPRSKFDTEQVLVFSDVDPALTEAVETGSFGTEAFASTVGYSPRYFLINGKAFPETGTLAIGSPGDNTLLRLLNAGSLRYLPTVEGLYLRVVARDGNLLPFDERHFTVLLTPGQTTDAILENPSAGTLRLYDRRLHLSNNGERPGGMMTGLEVAGGGLEVAASPDGDGDLVADSQDNCTLVANPDQLDTNGDGYGNICDADINNDMITNFGDVSMFIQAFFGAYDADCDFNGDGAINFGDLSALIGEYGTPPGPAAQAQ